MKKLMAAILAVTLLLAVGVPGIGAAAGTEVLVDNSPAGNSVENEATESFGDWTTSSLPGYNGTTTLSTFTSGAFYKWKARLDKGAYEVFIYKVVHAQSDPAAVIEVGQGSDIYGRSTLDYTEGEAGFVRLGTFQFDGTADAFVKNTRSASGARADCVKFVRVGDFTSAQPVVGQEKKEEKDPRPAVIIDNGKSGTDLEEQNTACAKEWTGSSLTGQEGSSTIMSSQSGAWYRWFTKLEPGKYEVYLYKLVHTTSDPAAMIEVGAGKDLYYLKKMNCTEGETGFTLLGTFNFDGKGDAYVKNSRSSGNARADSVKFVRVGEVDGQQEVLTRPEPTAPPTTRPTPKPTILPDPQSYTQPPMLFTPEQNEQMYVPVPHFTWQEPQEAFTDPANPISYEIQIAADEGFDTIVDQDVICLNRYVPDKPLPSGTYWWRVTAVAGDGTRGQTSAAGRFEILPCQETLEIRYDSGVTDYQEIIQEAVDQAINLNRQGISVQINFEKSSYPVKATNGAVLKLSGAHNLIVNGNGATLLLKDLKTQMAAVEESEGILVQGFTIDHMDQLPFTQGTVTGVDQSGAKITVRMDEGYPTYDDAYFAEGASFMILIDPAVPGKMKYGTHPTISFQKEVEKKGEEFILTLATPDDANLFEVGDQFMRVARENSAFVSTTTDCTNVTLYDLTSLCAPSLHHAAYDSRIYNVLHCKIKIKEGNLFSGGGDGIHTRGMYTGPWIEGCEINGIGDDGIALYARPMTIQETAAGGNPKALLVNAGYFTLEPGNEVSFFEPWRGWIIQEAKVISVEKEGSGYRVVFDQEIDPAVTAGSNLTDDVQIWNRSRSCGDFVIRNNKLTNIRRYGMVFRAKRGIVENNEVTGYTHSAVMFLNETQYPNGLYCSEVIIQNNTIENAAGLETKLPAICMQFKRRSFGFTPGIELAESYGPKNILIRNNTINDPERPAVWLQGVKNIVLRDNVYNGASLEKDLEEHSRIVHYENVRAASGEEEWSLPEGKPDRISVRINGEWQEYDQPPLLINDRTMVPLRGIFEKMGAQVNWDDKTQTVQAVKGETSVRLTIGEPEAWVNGAPVALDQPAVLVSDRTLVPVRFVSETLGAKVQWDENRQLVLITHPDLPVHYHTD